MSLKSIRKFGVLQRGGAGMANPLCGLRPREKTTVTDKVCARACCEFQRTESTRVREHGQKLPDCSFTPQKPSQQGSSIQNWRWAD